MRILVTGSKGQLGSELRILSSENPQYQWIFTDIDELDICDGNSVDSFFSENGIDICINCAAYTAVDKAEDEEEKARMINAHAVSNLAKACKKIGSLLFHVSTDYVFDGQGKRPYREDDKLNPVSAYGRTKAEGEKLIRESECRFVIIRTSWLYSAYGNNFVKTMRRLGAERPSISVVNDQLGNPTWAHDLAKAIITLTDKYNGNPSVHELFHFSNEGTISWFDFATAIMDISELKCTVNPIATSQYPTKATRPAYSALDKTKIKSAGACVADWKESLRLCIAQLDKDQK